MFRKQCHLNNQEQMIPYLEASEYLTLGKTPIQYLKAIEKGLDKGYMSLIELYMPDTNRIVGMITYNYNNNLNAICNLNLLSFAKTFSEQLIFVKSLKSWFEYQFKEEEINKLDFSVIANNKRAVRLYDKLLSNIKYTRFVFRDEYLFRGKLLNEITYEVHRDDYFLMEDTNA